MFCSKCGNELQDDAVFCSKCGQLVGETKNTIEEVVLDEYQQKQKEDLAGKILMYGILSCAFISTFILSFLGIIFGAKGKKVAEYFVYKYKKLIPKAIVGKILSIVGFITGIVVTALLAFYIFVIIVALTAQ